ncbi:hypothetical protein [Actinomadura chokoriensis]|uniref:LppX_LprAFG lipoprotein n=1 Tax=Actinomadura chokoriensis TaxID=454156 RepID=A0ABV4QU22_9ACTN
MMTSRPSPRLPRIVATVAVSALLLSAAACGSEKGPGASGSTSGSPTAASPSASAFAGKNPNQILQEAQTALRGAKSFRVAGVMSSDGETVKIDLITDGTRAKGVLTVPVKGSSVTMQIIKVGSQYYFRGRSLWLKAGSPALANRIGNRWALGNAQMTLRFSIFTTPAGWAKFLDPDGSITREADATVNGKPAVTLKDDSEGLLWISAQEPHYPLRLGGGDASGGGSLNFTYDAPVKVAAPRNVVDLSKGAAGL